MKLTALSLAFGLLASASAAPTTSDEATIAATPTASADATAKPKPIPSSTPAFNAVKGTGSWSAAVKEAKTLVSKLTLLEKTILATGVGWESGPCVGNILNIPSIKFPGLCLQDSPLGVRFGDRTSSFPAGINVAATFDKDLMYKQGVAMGEEFRAKGINVALGPMMNLMRAPAAGRAWEGGSGDPYLTSITAAATVKGIQSQGVIATAKHYILNEQETFRKTGSSNVDDRTFHEVYLPPFKACVDAGVGAVMCAYNFINGTQACADEYVINDVLKGELGFQGFVMTDWWANYEGIQTALAGTDMLMPGDAIFPNITTPGVPPFSFPGAGTFWYTNLEKLVNNGTIPAALVDDKATRILAAWLQLKQNKNFPAVNFDSWTPKNNKHVDAQADHDKLIRQVGAASTIVLRNTKSVLPISTKKGHYTISLHGSDAGPGIHSPDFFPDKGGYDGTLAQGWGSGTAPFPYLVSPYEGISARARADHIRVTWDFDDYDLAGSQTLADASDMALVFVSANSGEEYITVDGNVGDRNNLTLWKNGDNLIQSVASKNRNTVVIVHAAGAVDMPWINNPNITAVIYALMPGQESGNALADVLFGAVNPSGRLPFTINADRTQYAADIEYKSSEPMPQVNYTEALLIDYRWNDAKNIEPVFAFGHGLSYTQFSYSNVKATASSSGKTATMSVDVSNSGKVAGAEVVQLYLGFPAAAGEPPKILRRFEKVNIKAGQRRTVKFTLNEEDFSIWQGGWKVVRGTFTAYVGASSRDIRGKSTFKI
ncbi:putative beta-glucosidase [Powellomyces hirtus]|nr:putative beta-glucosidase [Powellomyces hirtus]